MLLGAVPNPCDRALDIGCGQGEFARLLAQRAARVEGIDLSAAMVAASLRSSVCTRSELQWTSQRWPLPPRSIVLPVPTRAYRLRGARHATIDEPSEHPAIDPTPPARSQDQEAHAVALLAHLATTLTLGHAPEARGRSSFGGGTGI
ncbi:MAG: class I SAM-dependent methyltransferase [Actinomycetota bacterium]